MCAWKEGGSSSYSLGSVRWAAGVIVIWSLCATSFNLLFIWGTHLLSRQTLDLLTCFKSVCLPAATSSKAENSLLGTGLDVSKGDYLNSTFNSGLISRSVMESKRGLMQSRFLMSSYEETNFTIYDKWILLFIVIYICVAEKLEECRIHWSSV